MKFVLICRQISCGRSSQLVASSHIGRSEYQFGVKTYFSDTEASTEFLLHILERKVTARANLKLLIRKTMTMKIMNKENMTISADFVEKFWEIAQLIKVKSVYLQCFLRRWRMTREFLLHILQMKVSYPSLLHRSGGGIPTPRG